MKIRWHGSKGVAQLSKSVKVTQSPKYSRQQWRKYKTNALLLALTLFMLGNSNIETYKIKCSSCIFTTNVLKKIYIARCCFLTVGLYIPAATSGFHTQGLQGALTHMHATTHICTHNYTCIHTHT